MHTPLDNYIFVQRDKFCNHLYGAKAIRSQVKTVFHVEDSRIFTLQVASFVRKMGLKYIGSVESGEEALQILEKVKPDILIADVSLAGDVDGFAVGQDASRKFGIPILFCSSESAKVLSEFARETPRSGYLQKPIDYESFKKALYRLLYC